MVIETVSESRISVYSLKLNVSNLFTPPYMIENWKRLQAIVPDGLSIIPID